MQNAIERNSLKKIPNGDRLAFSKYSKVFDEKNNIYKDPPLHDWTSHTVDVYQTLTLATEHHMISAIVPEIIYIYLKNLSFYS